MSNTRTVRVRPTIELRDKLKEVGAVYGLGPRAVLLKAVRRALTRRYVPEVQKENRPRVQMRLVLTDDEKRLLRELARQASIKPEQWILDVANELERFVKSGNVEGDG